MSAGTGQGPGAPAGYVSEEAKRRFTITAGVLGAVFLLVQMILPFVIVMVLMPVMIGGAFGFRQINAHRAALWKGRIWYTEVALPRARPESAGVTLKSVLPSGERAAEQLTALSLPVFCSTEPARSKHCCRCDEDEGGCQ